MSGQEVSMSNDACALEVKVTPSARFGHLEKVSYMHMALITGAPAHAILGASADMVLGNQPEIRVQSWCKVLNQRAMNTSNALPLSLVYSCANGSCSQPPMH